MTNVPTPLPGVFYRKPSPDADEFAQPGDQVEKGQVIGLIEVMKSFSELKAPAGGTVQEFLVEDGDEVTVGQDVAVIE
jgi:acetyl-CoA carboxylase biotin carboxyl carrier protein